MKPNWKITAQKLVAISGALSWCLAASKFSNVSAQAKRLLEEAESLFTGKTGQG